MSTQVRTQETRRVLFVNGVQTFRITVQCVDRGELPDTHLFLLQIVDSVDPQQDVFVRIVELADLDALNTDPDEAGYKPDRSAAISSGKAYWRAAAFTKDYTDFNVANAAVTAIADRLNTLVSTFTDYDTAFKTSPTETKYYPSADNTTIENMKDAYETAYESYEAAGTAVATAQGDLTDATTALAKAETDVSEWSDFEEGMQSAQDILVTTKSAFSDIVAVYAKTFLACVDEFTDDYTRRFGDYQEATYQVSFSTWLVDLASSDIGARVTVTIGGSSLGTLIAFDNVTHKMLITPDEPIASNPFTGVLTLVLSTRGTTEYVTTNTAVLVSSANAPNIQKLIACRNRFSEYRMAADEGVSKATQGITVITGIKNDVSSEVSVKEAVQSQARAAVTTAQEAVNKAAANLQTAYDNLEAAYDAVKTVCPSWAPSNPFPPLPAAV